MTDSGNDAKAPGKSSMRDLMKANRRGGSAPEEAQEAKSPEKKQKRERRISSYNADVEIWEKAMLIADYLQMDKGETIDTALNLFCEHYSTVYEQAVERQKVAEALKKARK